MKAKDTSINCLQTLVNATGAEFEDEILAVKIIKENLIEYAKAKCKEQRKICSNKCVGIWTESELVDRVLEPETPDFE